MRGIFNHVYTGKKVLVTGHTGFKGSWLCIWLEALGARVIGYALPPNTQPSMFEATELEQHMTSIFGDITDSNHLEQVVTDIEPDMVFHLAAQPLVRLSYDIPRFTYETNIMGTLNLLEAVRKSSTIKVCTVITSDKCYENREWEYGYRENDPLGGYDPYSSSKAGAELVVQSYQRSFFNPEQYKNHGVALASARAGNVIGGGDWAEERIVPDAIRALSARKPLIVRNPHAIRPWQHVLEPLSGYLWLAALQWCEGSRFSSAWNFGPNNVCDLTVGNLASEIIDFWGGGEWQVSTEERDKQVHEANYLKLDCTKSLSVLGWAPVYKVGEAIKATVDWYREFYNHPTMNSREFTLAQIAAYVERAQELGLPWAEKDECNAAQR